MAWILEIYCRSGFEGHSLLVLMKRVSFFAVKWQDGGKIWMNLNF
jgi:hypothetical protein